MDVRCQHRVGIYFGLLDTATSFANNEVSLTISHNLENRQENQVINLGRYLEIVVSA